MREKNGQFAAGSLLGLSGIMDEHSTHRTAEHQQDRDEDDAHNELNNTIRVLVSAERFELPTPWA